MCEKLFQRLLLIVDLCKYDKAQTMCHPTNITPQDFVPRTRELP